MRLLICHERFLFRYGADRVFILIAKRLKALGWHVSMLAARYDREELAAFADEILTLPLPNCYERSDELASRWLANNFAPEAARKGGYDLIIHGGWPLFAATEVFRSLSPIVFFLDHGVVPAFGYPVAQQRIFALLKELRVGHLHHCTHAAAVSDFISRTQTVPDTLGKIPVRTILNGADHLAAANNPQGPLGPELARVRDLAKHHPLILNLGRYETGTYKNSQNALEAFHLVRSACPEARFLALETEHDLRLPPHLTHGVVPLGHPDDATLEAILPHIHCGISLSLWEGYNLPLVELMRSNIPAFALSIGAHPEVVPDPWFLAGSGPALAAKVLYTIAQPQQVRARLESPQAASHWRYLTWIRFVDEMLEFLGIAPEPAALPR